MSTLVEKLVNNFNCEFRTGDSVSVLNTDGGTAEGEVQAPAEIVDGRPLVSIEGVGLINLIDNFVSLISSRETQENNTSSILEAMSFVDDEYIPLENDSDDETPPVQFGGGDFGGGGSSDSFETPEDEQQDENWEGDESEAEQDDSDQNDDDSDDN